MSFTIINARFVNISMYFLILVATQQHVTINSVDIKNTYQSDVITISKDQIFQLDINHLDYPIYCIPFDSSIRSADDVIDCKKIWNDGTSDYCSIAIKVNCDTLLDRDSCEACGDVLFYMYAF